MERQELAAWLRLALVPGLGNIGGRKLLAAFGLPEAIFTQTFDALAAVMNQRAAAVVLATPAGWEACVEATWQWLEHDHGRRAVLVLGDREYPPALLQIEDPPLVLYRQGLPLDAARPAVAVVGSRNATAQGVLNARLFSRAFAQAGVTVVSGMALGIDGAAHEGALEGAAEAGVATIAVVGTGLDRVYPSRHLELAHRIATRGALLSEYHLGTPPLKENFPKRNRLISGLSQGTLVVEAALQSGSLITARMAAEQGKDVFAIPGSIHSPHARGCHALLRQGAKLVESAQDVLEDLQLVPRAAAADEGEPAERSEEDPLLEAMGHEPVGLDALIARTGIPASHLQATLLELELAGQVSRLPGGLFQRLAAA